jgi:hypothetical protein
MKTETATAWLEIDVTGLRKTLERKGKAWAIFELVQNAWDEDSTEVAVTLTRPKNGKSALTCVDNSPTGYRDLATAHTMFKESYKKADATKRGRFNVGEKYVLALCDEARVTSTTGRVIFERGGKRKTDSTKTKVGSEFSGVISLTDKEYDAINKQVLQLFPPIKTTFNGIDIPTRKIFRTFQASLPTEIADDGGVLRLRQRKTEVRLYTLKAGEKSSLYEKGLPVVEIDAKWHVDVQQKIPLNIERDNVTPSYMKGVYVTVLNEMKDHISEEDATASWVRTAAGDKRVSDEAIVKVMAKRFGEKRVSYDPSDKGSNKEAVSRDHIVVTGGSLSKGEWENVRRAKAITPAGQLFPTNITDRPPKETISPNDYDAEQKRYVRLIETVSPLLIDRTATVKIINDEDLKIRGCSRWEAQGIASGTFIFEINLAFHDCSDWEGNYYLLIHELSHHKVQSNDHLVATFYETVNELGATLAQLAIEQPELFGMAEEELGEMAA